MLPESHSPPERPIGDDLPAEVDEEEEVEMEEPIQNRETRTASIMAKTGLCLEKANTELLTHNYSTTSISALLGNLKMPANLSAMHLQPFLETTDSYNEMLKDYRLVSKNYATMYITKAAVLTSILTNILEKMADKVREINHVIYDISQSVVTEVKDKSTMERWNTMKDSLESIKKENDMIRERINVDLYKIKKKEGKSFIHPILNVCRGALNAYVGAYTRSVQVMGKNGKLDSSRLEAYNNVFLNEYLMLQSFQYYHSYLITIVFNSHIIPCLKALLLNGQGVAKQIRGFDIKSKLNLKPLDFSMSNLIERSLRDYMKTKMEMDKRYKLKDIDINLFISSYNMLYPATSPFIVNILECTSDKHQAILVIDVSPENLTTGVRHDDRYPKN